MSSYDEEMQQRAIDGDIEAQLRLMENYRARFPLAWLFDEPGVKDWADLPSEDTISGK